MNQHTNTLNIPETLMQHVQTASQVSEVDYQHALADFKAHYPAYDKTSSLDALREREYARLDAEKHVYLDYTGGGLYAASQIQKHMQLLMNGVYGNPHSSNPSSMASTWLDESARTYVLDFFNADPDEYTLIFTPNASGALRLVGEAYPFADNGQYLLTFDNHNSVNGIREYARNAGVAVNYVQLDLPELRINEESLLGFLDQAIAGGNNLFAYPAQSNFSGVQHDLKWIEIAREKGWDILLDCAAFAPTNRLDFSVIKPDFVPLSFYKIFGYPTGIGALIARRDKLEKLHRPWFAGGTITVASVQGNTHYLAEGPAAFEDGTIDYLNLPGVEIGLRHIKNTGIDTIHERVVTLTGYLLETLTSLKHSNGNPLVKIYGPTDIEKRGGTIALNLYDADHTIFDYRLVESLANEINISLRTGCFCNPGAGEIAHNISADEMKTHLRESDHVTFEQLVIALTADGKHESVGAIRVSLGIASNFRDVYQFIQFLKGFLDQKSDGLLFKS